MKRSSRLSVVLHVLAHMADEPERGMTSEEMARCADTNPVVIRRSFAGLREAGIVSATKGHGGGWRLAKPAEEISLGAIHAAIGERLLPLRLATESPNCLIEQVVNRTVESAIEEAEALLAARLATVSLAELSAQVRGRRRSDNPEQRSHAHGL